MADIADNANDTAEFFLSLSLSNRAKDVGEKGIGLCFFCCEVLDHDGRWCDAQCRDDYQREKINKA